MTTEKEYKINEIFYSLQGEGRYAGRAAIFIRFSGCNLKCPFCDTDFKDYTKMNTAKILQVLKQWHCGFVVLTGGEPTLQVDYDFIDTLHYNGYFVAMETNGTKTPPINVDWVTVSPKAAYVDKATPIVPRCDEIKVVFDGEHEVSTYDVAAKEFYLQPCDTGNKEHNAKILKSCIEYIKEHPQWKLSLQQQKIIGVR